MGDDTVEEGDRFGEDAAARPDATECDPGEKDAGDGVPRSTDGGLREVLTNQDHGRREDGVFEVGDRENGHGEAEEEDLPWRRPAPARALQLRRLARLRRGSPYLKRMGGGINEVVVVRATVCGYSVGLQCQVSV